MFLFKSVIRSKAIGGSEGAGGYIEKCNMGRERSRLAHILSQTWQVCEYFGLASQTGTEILVINVIPSQGIFRGDTFQESNLMSATKEKRTLYIRLILSSGVITIQPCLSQKTSQEFLAQKNMNMSWTGGTC